MNYSSTALLALVVHCIVNYNTLRNRHYRNDTPAGRTYMLLLWSVVAFYIFDAIWGFLYDAHMLNAVFADTVLYFISMIATVFLWTRFVINYLDEKHWMVSALYHTGWLFLVLVCIVLILNFFIPVMFWFDESGEYHAADLRYAVLALQIVMFMVSACYVLFTNKDKEQGAKRHHWAIGAFGIAMSIMVIFQVLYPLLPLYSIGWLFGTCILHTFVLEDMKEDRRLELEEMIRREQARELELGSAKKLAYTDSLTGVKSSHAYVEAEKKIDERISSGELKDFGVVVFDVNGLKIVNDTKGHEAGDRLIQDACRHICATFKHSPVFRIGGDEFVAMLEGDDFKNRRALLDVFNTEMEENLRKGAVVVASGFALFRHGHDNSYRRVFERADTRMYDRKDALKAMD